MDFEQVARGYGRHLALLPGWGFDASIFAGLDLPYDYVRPQGLPSPDLPEGLHAFLGRRKIRNITLFGWSMGAYLALDFYARYPSLVDALLLVSLRRAFPEEEVEAEAQALIQNQTAALKRFYRRCFLGQAADYTRFVAELEEAYLAQWDLVELLSGLNYLKGKIVDLTGWSGCPVRIFHGGKDVICTLDQIAPLPGDVALEVLPWLGHLPFLASDFGQGLRGEVRPLVLCGER